MTPSTTARTTVSTGWSTVKKASVTSNVKLHHPSFRFLICSDGRILTRSWLLAGLKSCSLSGSNQANSLPTNLLRRIQASTAESSGEGFTRQVLTNLVDSNLAFATKGSFAINRLKHTHVFQPLQLVLLCKIIQSCHFIFAQTRLCCI